MIFLNAHHGQGDFDNFSGIKVEPTRGDGRDVKVVYDGLLAKNGADQVFMRAGFGNRKNWTDVYDHKLQKTEKGWESDNLHMNDPQLNFCFKDSANHWDNNKGENWSYTID